MSEQDSGEDEQLVIYRCKKCGKISVSLGWIHGQAEKHNPGLDPWGIIPDPRKTANPDHLNTIVEAVCVEDHTVRDVEEVPTQW